jgi:Rieske Fe-S protein
MNDKCSDCSLGASRRQFLREAGAALAVLATLGVSVAEAEFRIERTRAVRTGPKSVTYPIPPQDGVQIDDKQEVILVRWQGSVYAFNLSCPHKHTALKWQPENTRFQCPKHKSKYSPDGHFLSGKATRSMDRFALKREGSNVVVDLSVMYKEDQNLAGWNSATLKVA